MTKTKKPESGKAQSDEGAWSKEAKIGAAAVGSAALVAALLYAGKKYKNRNAPAPRPKKVRDDD